ncbi:N-acetylmuramoyl-L-alanine amidase family protein [Nitrosophilus alvini]|uniref:N-acetylmuramoyl-L-alanine amidase family protein n=1 Tax=Nitrosophilus alvini TaxID=2714855 RepID=UPI001909117D|nr:N-acetylmuramoyl-L-alanine amidase [Nitrosophilus alvini]
MEGDEKAVIESLKSLIEGAKILGYDATEYKKKLKNFESKGKKSAKKKKVASKKIEREKKEKKKSEKIRFSKSSKRAVLKSVKFEPKKVIFEFSRQLDKKEIRFFKLNKKTYKDVYDIKGVWPRNYRKYNLSTVKELRIAQFDKERIRVVFEDKKPIKSSYKIDGKSIVFYLNSSAPSKSKIQNTKKRIQAKSVSKNAPSSVFYRINKIVVIDPGHGGKDVGAVGYKRKREKDAVLAIAKRVYKELKKRGYKVYLTRSRDKFVNLRSRTKYANRKKADIFISIHANAAPKKSKYLSMKGIETFFLSPARSKRAKDVAALENKVELSSMGYYSKMTFLNFLNRERIIASNKLAIDIQKWVLSNLRMHFRGVQDGGVREAPFWVLVGAQMPSVLVEVGYITNPTEAKRLFNPLYQKLLAQGIADGIDSYFEKN